MTEEIDDGSIQFEAVQHRKKSACRPDEVAYHRIAISSPRVQPVCHACEVTLELGVLQGMKRHALRDRSTELAGILIGHHWENSHNEPHRGVWIQQFIEAEAYESTRASFKFTHDSWAGITEKKRSQFPNLDIVGWYHTHPGWGIFLSGHDQFICNHFFPDWFQLAIVLDPRQLIWGTFDRCGSSEMRIRTALFLRSAELGQSGLDALCESTSTNDLGLFSLHSIAVASASNPESNDAELESHNQGDLGVQKEAP
jgi:proteasome lid subunit RPN8/RPN11